MWAHLFLIDAVAAEPPTSPHPRRTPFPPFLPETIPTQPRTGAGESDESRQAVRGRKNLRPFASPASVLAYLYTPLAPSSIPR